MRVLRPRGLRTTLNLTLICPCFNGHFYGAAKKYFEASGLVFVVMQQPYVCLNSFSVKRPYCRSPDRPEFHRIERRSRDQARDTQREKLLGQMG